VFLINSSVGSFAAAPTSLDTKVRVQKNIINHDLLLISEKISQIVGLHYKSTFCDGYKKDLFTPIYRSKLMRTHARSLTSLFNLLSLLLSERGAYTFEVFASSYPPKWGQTLSRSYGRCIAEFLSEGSLVSLSLLDSSTCVGLRYGRLSPYVHLLF
jgi:hypothetical protein